MDIAPLSIAGAWVCQPRVHGDDRGAFLEWFRGDTLAAATGREFVPIQANHSVSRRGVVRGVHFADVPPGQAKYVYCPVGALLDVVVDLRVGSPTFGAVESIVLDDVERQAVFIGEGLGHAFCALRDGTAAAYLVSAVYNPAAERTITPLDPELGIPWPSDVGSLVLSDKDTAGPTLSAARDAGVLPSYDDCLRHYAET